MVGDICILYVLFVYFADICIHCTLGPAILFKVCILMCMQC